jgi:dihydrofolate reductase
LKGGDVRKVVAVELVSLDGVMESPEEWASSYSNDEMEETNASGMAASDALLMGRVTYEQMAAYWPNQPGGVPMVDYINSVPKYVVSTTLKEPLEWDNSNLIEGNVAEEIARLKRQPGEDITILGTTRSLWIRVWYGLPRYLWDNSSMCSLAS